MHDISDVVAVFCFWLCSGWKAEELQQQMQLLQSTVSDLTNKVCCHPFVMYNVETATETEAETETETETERKTDTHTHTPQHACSWTRRSMRKRGQIRIWLQRNASI